VKNTNGFPLYVKLGLFGVHGRKAALLQFWLGIAISIILLRYIFDNDSFIWTMVFCAFVLLTAKWYWSCIQWVDKNSKWEK
jgi:hypothetical protein